MKRPRRLTPAEWNELKTAHMAGAGELDGSDHGGCVMVNVALLGVELPVVEDLRPGSIELDGPGLPPAA